MEKTYLITGASSDIGVELTRCLAKEHSKFILLYNSGFQKLNILKNQLTSSEILLYRCDLSDIEETTQLVNTLLAAKLIPTHIIHLPALAVISVKHKNFDTKRFLLDFNLQVTSIIEITKGFMPLMAKSKYGRVVFMLTSYLMGAPPKNVTAYVAVKSALQGVAKCLAIEYAASGVTVNCVAPSMVQTNFLKDISDIVVEASAEANPMGRNATVSDVVPAIDFLLSDEARFITGTCIPVTGGSSID